MEGHRHVVTDICVIIVVVHYTIVPTVTRGGGGGWGGGGVGGGGGQGRRERMKGYIGISGSNYISIQQAWTFFFLKYNIVVYGICSQS